VEIQASFANVPTRTHRKSRPNSCLHIQTGTSSHAMRMRLQAYLSTYSPSELTDNIGFKLNGDDPVPINSHGP